MKNKYSFRGILFFLIHIVFLSPLFLFAQDTQLLDADKKAQFDIQVEFKQFSSCENMQTVLEKFLDKLPQRRYREGLGIIPMMATQKALMPESSPIKTADAPNDTITSSSTDYSQTNIQKINVDEPDIIKTNGEYIFYYNQQDKKISIIRSPLDQTNATLTLNNAEEINTILLPEQFENINLFTSKTRLVIIATRYANLKVRSLLNKTTRTIVAIYDISNPKVLQLLKFSDIDGYYTDARLIKNNLYIISNLDINRRDVYPLLPRERKKIINKKTLPSIIDRTKQHTVGTIKKVIPLCKEIKYILPSDKTIQELDLYPSFTIITAVDIEKTTQSPRINVLFGNQGQIHMSEKNLYVTQNLWIPYNRRCPWFGRCLMPYREEGQQTLIHKFEIHNLDIKYKATTMVQGTTLTQYSMDEDDAGNFRILTKKSRADGTNLYVLDPSLQVRGKITGIEPGEQFKASRYIGDKLYLVTFVQTDPLFVIDIADTSNPKIIGELKIPGFSTYLHPLGNIQNGKQYLIGLGYDTSINQRGGVVTSGLKLDLYEVDYGKQQVGGNDDCDKYTVNNCPSYCVKQEPTKTVSQTCTSTGCTVGSVVQGTGSCVSKSKIDPCASYTYSNCPSSCVKKCTNGCENTPDLICPATCDGPGSCVATGGITKQSMISVRQLFSKTIGGKGSDSDVLNNPRLFVMDKNNVVTMPMVLRTEINNGQQCNVTIDARGVEKKSDCYPITKQVTTFAGMKSFKFDTANGIKETYSVDYAPLLKQLYNEQSYGNEDYWSYRLRDLGMRVGYAGDALYMINADFGHFFIPGTKHEKYLMFDKTLQQQK